MKGGIAVSILEAVIQGIVAGLGEFLPISSSGHLAVLRDLFGMTGGQSHLLLDGMIHMGAVIAMLFMSWGEVKSMLHETSLALHGASPKKSTSRSDGASARLFLLILTASVPLLLLIPLGRYIVALSQSVIFVGAMLVLNGFVLMLYPKFVVSETKNEKTLPLGTALLIGLCQCAAILPGMSRTAVIMTGCASSGSSRSFSVRFALLCAVPAMFGISLYEIVSALSYGVVAADIPAYILGMICAMLISVPAIGIMRMSAKRKSFGALSYYCLIIGVLTIILSMIF